MEIGASVAHAEEVTDVSTWENATKSYGSNQTVKVKNGDKVLAAFTTNANVTLSDTPSSGDGTNGSIKVNAWSNNCFRNVTIYENTTLLWKNDMAPAGFTAKLSGGGASFSGGAATVKLAADSTADATIDFGRWVTDSDGWSIFVHIITGTDGTKLSEVGGFMLCGTVDVSEASSISGFDGVRAHVDANDTVKTAQVTIHGPSEIDLQSAFEISDNTTTISGGTFGDIEATGTGKVILGATDSRSTGNVTAGNITADEVVGINVKAKSIKANTVTASSITADSITADTLSVLKQSTAKMVNLNVDTIDASTVVLADGAIVNGKDGSSAANIKTDTLQVDSEIAAAGIKNANVTAKTAGKQVSIVGRTGLKIPKKDMEDIAKAANMKEGTYTSATTEAAKKNVTEMLDSADQLGTEGTPSTNTGATKINSDDVTLDDSALAGKLLSLNKGDNVYLLKDRTGTLTYTEGTNVPKLAHTYTDTTDAGTATVATTGSVKQDANDLVLHVDDQKYTFDLSSGAKDKDTFLTSTNTGKTVIRSDDVTLKDGALAGKLLSLNKGDNVYLLKDGTGALTYTEGTNVPALAHTYTSTADAGSATVTTTGTVKQSGNDLVLKVDGVKYAFKLAPAVKDGDTLLTLSYTGDTEIGKGDVTVGTSGVLKNLKKDDKVYLLKKTNGTLIATDITDTVNLPTIYGTITGDVAEDDSNNLVLNVTKAESLTDNLKDEDNPYKYIVVVEDDKKNTENKVTVGASETADKSAIAALAKNDTDDTELKDNTLTVNGKVTGRAVGANSVAGNATQNNVTIGAGATVDGFVAGGMTQDGTANNNTVTINGGTVTGDVYGGYSEKEAKGNTVTMSGGTVKGTIYGSNLGSGASSGTTVKKSSPRRAPALTETESTSSGNTMKIYGKDNTAGNLAKFDNYNFYLPAGTSNGATMLHLTDKADTDMTNSKVTVRANGALNLYNNESVYLSHQERWRQPAHERDDRSGRRSHGRRHRCAQGHRGKQGQQPRPEHRGAGTSEQLWKLGRFQQLGRFEQFQRIQQHQQHQQRGKCGKRKR